MSEFAARIGRVRMKSGGADVRILPQPNSPFPEEEDYRGRLIRNARAVAEMGTSDDPLAGYVLIGIFDSGATSVGFRYNRDSRHSIPSALLPTWIAEVLRRDIITSVEAENRFDIMFQWQDG